MNKAVKFFGLLGGTILVLLALRWTSLLLFDGRQILSIGIFSMFIYGTLLFGEFRLAFAFGGIALLMACGLLTVERFTQAASLDVLVFLIGTFLVIGYLEESRFFEHVVSAIVGAVGPRPQLLLITMMLIASIASALVGEVTAILFMAGAMLHLTSKYKLNPVPFVIMLVFACNDGSAMSSVGNPIGVLIALKTGLGFVDFVLYAAPVAIVVNVATFAICRWYFAESFAGFAAAVHEEFALRARASRPAMALAQGGGGETADAETLAHCPRKCLIRNVLLRWLCRCCVKRGSAHFPPVLGDLAWIDSSAGNAQADRSLARPALSRSTHFTRRPGRTRGRWGRCIWPARRDDDGSRCTTNGFHRASVAARRRGSWSSGASTGGRLPFS